MRARSSSPSLSRLGTKAQAGGHRPRRQADRIQRGVVGRRGRFASGWTGRIDAAETANGQSSRIPSSAQEGNALHVTTGPAATYWNPGEPRHRRLHGEGDLHRAEVHEPEQPSPSVRIVIGGNDLGTPQQSYLYCAAYGNGMFIVRGFAPLRTPPRIGVPDERRRGRRTTRCTRPRVPDNRCRRTSR
jgi:hypothetical protein